MYALSQPEPNTTIVLLGATARLAPLSLPLRSGAADLAVVLGPELNPNIAHRALARGLARDPHNLAYRAAMAHLTTTPPVKGATLGGTEVKP